MNSSLPGTRPAAHIAMFSVAAHGHVNPSLELIRELVRRGHRVTYAIAESFADTVAATGAEPRIITSTLPTSEDRDAWGGELIDHLRLFLADAGRALPQLLKAYQDDRPDLILYDPMAYAARALADRWRIPAIQLSPHAVAWEGYEDDMAAELSGPPGHGVAASEPGGRQAHAWLANNGTAIGPGRIARRPERCIALLSKVLQPHADRVDSAVYTFTGPCRADRSRRGDWSRPAGAEKVVLISLGTVFTKAPDFYRACAAAFGDLPGWHVVLQIGAGLDPTELGEVPDNIEVRTWVPQLAILEQADAFITHAGASSAQEGLACGVPMVAVPQAVDQFANAEMLAALGVARYLPKDRATPRNLREAVLSLLNDPDVPRHVSRLQQHLAHEGGTRQAADLVEAALPSPL
ncbi:glycosyltransferase, MGT family [Streptomyces sp. 2224.1]|uniref:macrolide family glycosyltransferase n=1 Tax=unclassified Streptomyces TaxID=2593676 RepID=UPI00088DC751|nr:MULTISPECIES: macrolide family glycosyltransferase [unclassified Streptomyces]PBC83969.1 MGT family glycosyltransferase [Streptomyces sp. 2321.6]SDR36563.1 glycosyltransferase, MGT family [Streptomyces sp. KS_16]SEB86678.1 glycosyltransferase, MGT family [Streptomyces sp. 2224.1]SED15292.1 glycosyltransferase, MGT family [Streptomyces sp. 2133.1]SEE64454.1 glycosyltransferase, MGT family [Streptomyces sp. 2112.3]